MNFRTRLVRMLISDEVMQDLASRTVMSLKKQEQSDMYGNSYSEFEEKYRGPRDEVSTTQEKYLNSILLNAPKNPKVVDLGCGRGEFVELCHKAGINVLGIDVNKHFVNEMLELGLNARESEIFTYLADLKNGSLDVITLFHVIEHMSATEGLSLLSECQRVLRREGLLIIETPNPETLHVGANTFWLDPTHVRPWPPKLIINSAHDCGFFVVEEFRGSYIFSPEQIAEVSDQAFLRQLLTSVFGAQDFGVVFKKLGSKP